jgi:N-acetylglucosaminyldiphosphoundecaprenol N-acetyl-beta-D-mannosaminyltransferase
MTLTETVDAAEYLIRQGGGHQHVVLNAAKVVQAHDDPELASILRACSLINADGQSVVWASRILGSPLPERVAGIDLMYALWDRAAIRGLSVYLLGATTAVVTQVADLLVQRGIAVVGHRDGYWTAEDEDEVVAAVQEAQPDLLFLAIPSPRKERFLSAHLEQLGTGLVVGVGGSFDVAVGLRRRAPAWAQKAGLEWAFRLVQEPRRMFKRYLVGNLRFIRLVASYRFQNHRRELPAG